MYFNGGKALSVTLSHGFVCMFLLFHFEKKNLTLGCTYIMVQEGHGLFPKK